MAAETKTSIRCGLVVFGVALLVQMLYLAEGGRDPTFTVPIVDALTYHQSAASFAHGGRLTEGAFWQPPFYPLFLGCIYRFLGESIFVARVIQACLGAVSCTLLWWIGRRLFSNGTGLLAGLMLAVYGPFVFFNTRLLPAGLAIFLDLVAFALLLLSIKRQRWWVWFSFGLVSGLSTITVVNGIVIPVVAAIWLGVTAVARQEWKRTIVAISMLVVGLALPVSAVTVRNYRLAGEFVLISTNGGVNFYIGNNADADRTVAVRPGAAWKQLLRKAYMDGTKTDAQQSAFFFSQAIKYIQSQPVDFLRGIARKSVRFINAREIPRNVDIYAYRDFSGLLSILVWRAGSFAFPFALIAPLAALGSVVVLRFNNAAHRRGAWLLMGVIGIYGLSVVMFFITSRYRLPMVPFLIILSSVGVVWLVKTSIRDATVRECTSVRGLLLPTACGLIAVLAVNWPISAPSDGVAFRAELYTNLGQTLADMGRLDKAEQALHHALRLNVQYASSYHQLGLIKAKQGDLVQATSLFEKSLQLAPDQPEVQWLLGNAYFLQGRENQAKQSLRRSLMLDPYSPEAQAVMGDICLKFGPKEQAIEHYRRALNLVPYHPEIRVSLGDALVANREYTQGIAAYRRALKEGPPHTALVRKLALLLASCPDGRVRDCNAAIQLSQQFCDLTGRRDPIALEILASVLAECGSPDQAVRIIDVAIKLAQPLHNPSLIKRLEDHRQEFLSHK